MRKVTIDISADDIANAYNFRASGVRYTGPSYNPETNCPIAYALRRAFPDATEIRVHPDGIEVNTRTYEERMRVPVIGKVSGGVRSFTVTERSKAIMRAVVEHKTGDVS